ncbi:MAG: site-2 protease family protein [Ktedonobacterales bacterium]
MTDQPKGHTPNQPPAPEPPLAAGSAPWAGGALPDVYPPPPEYYQQRAQAAPTLVATGPAPSQQWQPMPAAPGRRRRWFAPARYPHQPITILDVTWTFLSAAISFAIYAKLLGWPVGLGLTVLLFVHEMGHFIVASVKRVPARLPIFVPFLGAFVLVAQTSRSALDDAQIALAGPFAGALGSAACAVAWWITRQPDLLTIALINFLINLFNLIPFSPLDGGRATRVISRRALIPLLIVVLIAGLCTFDIVLLLVAGFGLRQVYLRPSDAMLLRTETNRKERRTITALYFGLLGAMLAVPLALVVMALVALGPALPYLLPSLLNPLH